MKTILTYLESNYFNSNYQKEQFVDEKFQNEKVQDPVPKRVNKPWQYSLDFEVKI